ncbi:alpha/beta fold hydrolase [Kosakonia quasisacchari]|uniref:Alpha/beta fold hydrolase n=1 Tax=Kosakonia quasisacchari TaxID=2529380 RepID=A0A4R0HFP7_9ENTR|nr:alpha/beta fold hydrolase [Kosakonia quasisacchari]TCC09193.1 alpha/beta fold hydrolase [Kosakonia quasisacchari]
MLGFKLIPLAKKFAVGLLVLGIVFFIGRVYQSEKGPSLQSWHRWSADEMRAEEIDRASFADYLAREDSIFRDMKAQLTDALSDDEKTPLNRFYAQSRVYPARFQPDWNRSQVLMPQGNIRGAAVLLHGLTDSPYSMRYLAQAWQQQGFVVVVPRLPGHGTAPGALAKVNREQWLATTRLAVREATRITGSSVPLHLVGYSNGGALAMQYALESLSNTALRRPQQIILLSPMIGVPSYARFAGLAGWPAAFPAFAKAAWLNVVPEFNPYKYNSFPVNAARQSWLLTQALQQQLQQAARSGLIKGLPPVMTFQSVMDSTVGARAVVDALYRYLPQNGSELVLFDINQAANAGALFRPSSWQAVNTLLPAPPRHYTTTVIANVAADSFDTVARTTPAQSVQEKQDALHIAWPPGMFSLSHIALPFPLNDPLYGLYPAQNNQYGISLGTISLRGETNTLTVSLDTLMRATANPFFPWMMAQINQRIACSDKRDIAACMNASRHPPAVRGAE